MSREQLAVALSDAEYVLRNLRPLLNTAHDEFELSWRKVAIESGLSLTTVYQVAAGKSAPTLFVSTALVSWLHSRMRPDPTHGTIDRDIQAYVNGMNPTDIGRRTALEQTIQAKRDRGERLAVDG